MGNTQWVVMYAAIDGNYTTDRNKAVHGTHLICFGRVPDGFVQQADHPITVIMRMADIFCCSIDYLLGRTSSKK